MEISKKTYITKQPMGSGILIQTSFKKNKKRTSDACRSTPPSSRQEAAIPKHWPSDEVDTSKAVKVREPQGDPVTVRDSLLAGSSAHPPGTLEYNIHFKKNWGTSGEILFYPFGYLDVPLEVRINGS